LKVASPLGGPYTINYQYDERGRLDSIYYGSLGTYIEYPYGYPVIHYPDGTVKAVMKDGIGNIKSVFENGVEAITYNYNSNGNIKTINSHYIVVSFEYDDYGRRTSVINPNSGVTSFEYDNLGQLISQTDSRDSVILYYYDRLGRKISSVSDGDSTIYEYYTSGVNIGKIKTISILNGPAQSYRYDNLGRLIRSADSIPGEISMVTTYGYDIYNHNTSVTYPSGTTINYVYDNNNYGYLSEIWNGSDMLWKLNSSNSCGQPLNYNLGNVSDNLQVTFTYDYYKRLSSKLTGQMKQAYSFDPASGNLLSRDYRVNGSPTGLTESFEYDNLNRLVESSVTGLDALGVTYDNRGNITNKEDAGDYSYDPVQVNAVTGITGNPDTIPANVQTVEYNSFNLTTYLKEESAADTSDYTITYNPLNQRIKSVCNPSEGIQITKYYSGNYEKIISGSEVKERLYIACPFGLIALLEKQDETTTTYFIETDHLGSIIGLINTDKSYAEHFAFDPWGRRRNPADWSYNNVPQPTLTDRGFTGHEHLNQLGLINMNGRTYDPVVGRFLGVDPVIQAPEFSQSYNGYSYCFNYPLKYKDPGGFEVDLLEIAAQLLASDYGGYWNPNSGISHTYTQDESDLFYEAYKCLAGYLDDRVWQFGYSGFSIDPTTVYKDKAGGIGFLANYYWYDFGIAFNKSRQLSHVFNLPSGDGGNGFINFIENTSVGRDVATVVAGGLDIATDGSIPGGKPRYQPRGFNPAVEAQVAKGMKVANGVVGVAGRALGVLSIVEHGNQAYQAFDSGNIWQGIGYTALTGLDIGLMFFKSNPAVLAGSFIYGVLDATAF
jgi:RHS repeat-associated protein